jgi:hypothetical protein
MKLLRTAASKNRQVAWVVCAGVACSLVVAGCSSSTSGAGGGAVGTSTSLPAWTKSLGPGVTVIPPTSETAGNSSPGGVAKAVIGSINAGKLSVYCQLVEPSVQETCGQAIAHVTSTGEDFKNIALGYVAIDGDQALVGMTGTFCNTHAKPTCTTNADPAAIFSSAKPFATLFGDEVSAGNDNSNAYSLFPTVKVGPDWYLDIPASDI